MEEVTHWHTQTERIVQKRVEESSVLGGQNVGNEIKSHSVSRTTSSKKSFRQGFLNWVAFERSLSPNISDLVRRTCPVVDCERDMGSEAQMRQHLKGCLHLKKGWYRCHETNREVQIGKCETEGCRELQQYKGPFSNAMHSLGRRLSRGCRPNRLVKKFSNKHSKITHMFGVDPRTMCLQASMDNFITTPEKQSRIAELSATRDVCELPAHGGFELYAGQATTNFDQSQLDLPELGVGDDSTQVSQFLAHGTYQPAELYASVDVVFEYLNDNAAQSGRYNGWDLTPSNYNITPDDLLNICSSTEDLTTTRAPMDTQSQWTPRSSNSMQSINTEVVSPMEIRDWNSRYSSTCIVSPTQSFTDSEMDQRESIFTPPLSRSTGRTSFSSMDSIKPTPNSTTEPLFSFLNEPDRMCEEPIEEFELPESRNIAVDGWNESVESGNILNMRYQGPIEKGFQQSDTMSVSNYQNNNSVLVPSQQQRRMPRTRIRRKPVASSPPRRAPLIQQLSPDIDYSAKTATPLQRPGKKASYQCEFCQEHFTDKSNLKRHHNDFSCKKHPDYSPSKDRKRFRCNFEECSSAFTRDDNLRVHQTKCGHFPPVAIALPSLNPYQMTHYSFGFPQSNRQDGYWTSGQPANSKF